MKPLFAFLLPMLLFGAAVRLAAQNPAQLSPEQIRAEISSRGYNPDEVETRMRARGFDPNNLSESQIPAARQALMEIFRELDDARPKEDNTQPLAQKQENPQRDDSPSQHANASSGEHKDPSPGPGSRIYGQQIFRDRQLSVYRQTSETTIPADYIMGPGDKLVVSIWGQVAAYSEELEVNTEGYVIPKTLSRVYLTGLTYEQAKKQLQAVFARRYPVDRANFAVSLTAARSIDVTITGEVFDYGSFRLSALNPAFNALVASGGPTDIGSVRNITLYRSGQAPRRLDVYQYLLAPAGSNVYLQSGDNIFVPVAERVVAINGAVRRPARYELIKGEQLSRLIEWAGGLRDDAYTTSIQIARTVNQQKTVIDVNLADLQARGQDFDLLDGDEVTIRTVNVPAENIVAIEGAVDFPGTFAYEKGMTVADLLSRARLNREARTDFAYLQRTRPDGTQEYLPVDPARIQANPAGVLNLPLLPKDRLIIFAQSRYADPATIQSEGAFRDARTLPYDAGRTLRISDLIELSGGLRPDAASFAYLIRTRRDNPEEKIYVRVNIPQVIGNPSAADNLVLEPFDRLLVQSKELFSDVYSVQVKGAVRNPGEYQWNESLKLQDVIALAGGLRYEAASDRVDVFRVMIRQNQPTSVVVGTFAIDSAFNVLNNNGFQLQPFDIIVVRTIPEFALQKMVTVRGEVRYPGEYALIDKNEQLSSLIQRAGGLTTEAFPPGATLYRSEGQTGFIVLRLDAVLKDPSNRHNFVLKAGDVLEIPKIKDLVSIRGASRAFDLYPDKIIGNNGGINVAYKPGKRAGWYVKEYAAGFSHQAQRKALTVEEANGRIRRTKNFGLFKIYPKVSKGSTINIARKPAPETHPEEVKKKVDWDVVFAETLAKATSVLTLLVLLQRL